LTQFPTVLVAAAPCVVQVSQGSNTQSMSCTNTANVISITIDQTLIPLLQSGSLQITVLAVQNPITNPNYGTGNFQIKTLSKGGITIDENTNFGSIGIADAYISRSNNLNLY
jgi:hypothetical protein